tara:strand:+ start:742 stop:1662 length:921 start_codon:yes stop_codon:yes gene_type:complete
MPLKIVFMGTPEFSLPTLQALIKNKLNILAVYTQAPKKSKRGQKINSSPVEEFAKKNKINFKNPINLKSEEELKNFEELSPDIVVVVAYGQIIPKNFLNKAKFGFINLHASLLPKWRGAAPIQRAIINCDRTIGLSIMKIDEELDSGPILFSKEFELDKNATHGEIEKKLSLEGADLLIQSLKSIEKGNSKFVDQDNSKATYAKKIDKNETKINWNKDANKVLAHIHGLSPNPGAWFEFDQERYKVFKAKTSVENGKPGCVLNDNLTIGCETGAIQILELQRQGKNKQTTKEFLLGKKINKGVTLV